MKKISVVILISIFLTSCSLSSGNKGMNLSPKQELGGKSSSLIFNSGSNAE